MGRYIDWSDLVGRYSQINKLGGAESVGSSFINYAEAEIDSRLSCAYTVPFSSGAFAPTTVKDLAIDMTLLKATFGKDKAWERMKTMLDEKIKLICEGTIAIIGSDGEVLGAVGGTVWSSNENYTPIFGMGDIEDFHVDPDRLEDEDAARD